MYLIQVFARIKCVVTIPLKVYSKCVIFGMRPPVMAVAATSHRIIRRLMIVRILTAQ